MRTGRRQPDLLAEVGLPARLQCTQNWQNPPRCVPSACATNPLMTGLDLSWCEQFVNGGG